MGFLSRIFANDVKAAPAPDDDYWYLPLIGKVKAGVEVNEYTALNYSAVWLAIMFISQTIASLPFQLYRADGNNRVKASGHPSYKTIHKFPNPYMPAMTFWETIIAHAVSWGNGYAEKTFDILGNVKSLWPIPPNKCDPVMRKGKLVYDVKVDGKILTLPRDRVLHIPGIGYDGFKGYSVITMARESIGLGIAAENFGSLFFGQGAHPGMVAKHPGRLGAEAHEALEKSLQKNYEGLGHAHRMMLLEEGMTLEKIGLPQKDSQYLETRQHQIEEIARWFNLPPHVLKDLTRATFSNIESQAQELVKYSLRPWMVRTEQHCDLQLLTPEVQGTHYHRWNAEGLLRGDSAARSEFYKSLWNMGAVSIDEIREKEDMNPLPDGKGKVHFIPLNTTTLERAIAGESGEPGDNNETV
jgi:HK97 family phage portal protein